MKSDQLLTSLTKERQISFLERSLVAIKSFSFAERVLFGFFSITFVITSIFLLWQVNEAFLIEVPAKGGVLEEGIIGTPRFINPLLAISDPDKDLTSLVYSGLLKTTPEGTLIPDLAESYQVSEDGLVYSVILKKDATFHDGKPVTANDIMFTVSRAVDPSLKSPKRANWEGVLVEKINEHEVRFILSQPYTPFIHNLTLGILPQHVWSNVTSDQFPFSQFNVEPIGSGPFAIKNVKKNSGGFPTHYQLKPFKNYALGEPYLSSLIIRIYPNEEELLSAYRKGHIQSLNGVTPEKALELEADDGNLETAYLPRVFGAFFNQNQATIFTHREVRRALDLALDKNLIVDQVLNGFGTKIDGPFPASSTYGQVVAVEMEADSLSRAEQAINILESNNWTRNEETGLWQKETNEETLTLQFSITTGDTSDLKKTAELLRQAWGAIGIPVEIRVFETGDLNQNVIRPRKYDVLLFGIIVGHDLDLYPFWHSSQRNDPGLNIALYTNITVDKLLEDLRQTTDQSKRITAYQQINEEITTDAPAVFLYSPDFIYLIPQNINNLKLGQLTIPGERFINIHEWYFETTKVWKIFTD